MRVTLFHWIETNRIMLFNTGSLVCTTFTASALGFIYWWLAARLFTPEAVGLASAAISIMTLLATISLLGLDSLLVGELPRQPGKERSLVSIAVILVGSLGGFAGLVFALITPLVSRDLQSLRAGPEAIAIFACGVSLTAITFVVDQAVIGLLRSNLQLWRKVLFALTKLLALLVVGLFLTHSAGLAIYATWAVGNILSLLVLFGFTLIKSRHLSLSIFMPQWRLVSMLKYSALQHHIVNLAIMAPTLILPVLVTIMLSAKANAWFYVSFTLANLISMVLYSLTSVLYAMNAAQPVRLARQLRLTLGLSLATTILANCFLLLFARQILSLFGPTYADQATSSLLVLGLTSLPLIVKEHYITIYRIHNRMKSAMGPIALGVLLELACPALGARLGHLLGLSIGWFLAIGIEAMYMSVVVYRAAMYPPQDKNTSEMHIVSA